jgi:hypothetical protein
MRAGLHVQCAACHWPLILLVCASMDHTAGSRAIIVHSGLKELLWSSLEHAIRAVEDLRVAGFDQVCAACCLPAGCHVWPCRTCGSPASDIWGSGTGSVVGGYPSCLELQLARVCCGAWCSSGLHGHWLFHQGIPVWHKQWSQLRQHPPGLTDRCCGAGLQAKTDTVQDDCVLPVGTLLQIAARRREAELLKQLLCSSRWLVSWDAC